MKKDVSQELLLSEDQYEKALRLSLWGKKIVNIILFFSFTWLSYLLWNLFFRSFLLVLVGIQHSSIGDLKKFTVHNSIELEITADPLTFFFFSAITVSVLPVYYLLNVFKKYWLN